MLALALVAGVGTALFRPATYALLGGIVSEERLGALNGLYGAARDAGQVVGPAVAGGLLLVASPVLVLGLNAATFALSALLLVLAQRDLAAGPRGYALLVSVYGCGLVAGSLRAGRGGDERRRHVAGIAVLGAGMVATALAPVLAAALVTFAVTGFGNGLFVVSNRVLLQRAVPEHLHGRAFGVLDAVDCWGLAGAVVAGGALATAAGGRVTFALSGAALLILFATQTIRREPAGRLTTATA